MTDQATKISPLDRGVGRPPANAFSAPDPPGGNGAAAVSNGGAEVVAPGANGAAVVNGGAEVVAPGANGVAVVNGGAEVVAPGANGVAVVNGGAAEVVWGPADVTDGIAGISALKGLIMYGASLVFAGLYAYFIVRIFAAHGGHKPVFDATLIAAAAGLAGVLGSAFALEIGTPTHPSETNPKLARALKTDASRPPVLACLWRVLSLEPSSVESVSWPKTFGIWLYALVATAVAVTYVVNQGETPDAIKALAVAFAGYVIALINAAYHGKAA